MVSTIMSQHAPSGACGTPAVDPTAPHQPQPARCDAAPQGRDGQRLQAAELALASALAAARDSVARCELALGLLADLRLPTAAAGTARAAPDYPTGNGTPGLTALNESRGVRAGDAAIAACAATPNGAIAATGHLTPREIEVVSLIAAGLSNKELAGRLFLSPRTVERHINNIYRKIDARSKADATAWAIRHDLG
jgi:DNA-binding CsgD family transcriptional regulator